ncbi:MAG: T9SS type A sorting domain-containing protein [Sporocytophaga sp.]|nr:T9SS type A sorting domain-containing protein [Sporocytophaga sp.]
MKKNYFKSLCKNFYTLVLAGTCLSGIVQAQSQNGLIHHYPFDNSFSNSASTHTMPGGTSFTGNRFSIAQTSYYVLNDADIITNAGIPDLPTGSAARSVAFWFQIPTASGTYYLFNYGPSGNGFVITYNNGNGTMSVGDGVNYVFPSIGSSTQWRHVVVTYEQEKFITYINGVKKHEGTLNLNTLTNPVSRIGSTSSFTSKGFKIDDLFIYDRAITATEVEEIYNLKCLPDPVTTIATNPICSGESTILNFSALVRVYASAAGGDALTFNDVYTTPNLNATTTYYIQAGAGSCLSNMVPVTVNVKPKANKPVSTVYDYSDITLCDSGTAKLSVEPHEFLATKWYDTRTGGNPIATGASVTFPNVKGSKSYYAAYEGEGYCLSARTELFVEVYKRPVVNFTSDHSEICKGETVSFGGFDNVSYTIFKGSNAVTSGDLYLGPFTYSDSPQSTSEYILTVGEWIGCMSADTLIVTVNELPQPVIIQNGTILSTEEEYQSYQWFKDGIALTNEVAETYEFTEDGDYSVLVTNDNGCSATSDAKSVVITSLNKKGISKVSNLYPNPTNSILYVELKEAGQIKILSILGEQLETYIAPAGTVTIDVSNLNTGVYMLQTDKGESIRFTKN